MKRVKVMLASMAVVSVLGALYSFSAKEAFTSTIYTSTTNTGVCNQANSNVTTTTVPNGTSFYFSTTNGGTCSSAKFYLKSNQ